MSDIRIPFYNHRCLSIDKNPVSNMESKFKRKEHIKFTPTFFSGGKMKGVWNFVKCLKIDMKFSVCT